MAIEEDPPAGVPEWVVTFGDMMSLLLTFFVLLFSMSGVKSDEKLDAMLTSMRKTFGRHIVNTAFLKGSVKLRNSQLEDLDTKGTSKQADMEEGEAPRESSIADQPRISTIRPGTFTTIGELILFDEASTELTAEDQRKLRDTCLHLQGKLLRIEIRGHTRRGPQPANSPFRDDWDLAFARCRAVGEFLINEGIERKRLVLGVLGQNDPLYQGVDPALQRQNSSVEVLLLDQWATDVEEQAK